MLNKGDKVSVLDDAIDGVVVEVKGPDVTIETTDGFNLTFKSNELIKIGSTEALNFTFNKNPLLAIQGSVKEIGSVHKKLQWQLRFQQCPIKQRSG